MKSFFNNILIGAALMLGSLLTACSADGDDAPRPNPGDANLRLKVAIATPGSVSRAGVSRADDSAPAGPNEMMHELRIIIVRPDQTIEHNDYITEPFLNNPAITAGEFAYRVQSDETKSVYLVVNESATRTDAGGNTVRVVDYDFSALSRGTKLPLTELQNLLVTLDSDTETLDGNLPMSECHKVVVPYVEPGTGSDISLPALSARLFVTRAAVKFTLNIKNSSPNNDFSVDGLQIEKLSRKEYFFPRDAFYNSDGEITSYVVPNIGNNEYYTFKRTYTDVTIPKNGGTGSLPAFYLLEGKYTDSDPDATEGLNYKLSLTLNGKTHTKYFPNLPQLPRNTHVVVNVDIKNADALDWQIDLRPYSSVVLNPDFGLPYPEAELPH